MDKLKKWFEKKKVDKKFKGAGEGHKLNEARTHDHYDHPRASVPVIFSWKIFCLKKHNSLICRLRLAPVHLPKHNSVLQLQLNSEFSKRQNHHRDLRDLNEQFKIR